MKRALIGFASLVFVLLLGALIAPNFMDWNQYKQSIIEFAEEKTGYNIMLEGDLNISLLPSPQAYISNVRLQSPQSQKYESVIDLKRLDLDLAFAPLLSGKVQVTSLELIEPHIYLENFSEGTQNWQTDQILSLMQPDTTKPGNAQSESGFSQNVSLDSVRIKNGKLVYYEEGSNTETIVNAINMNLKADALSGPFSGQGALDYAGRSIAFEGKTGRLNNEDQSIALNVEGSVNPEQIKYGFGGVIGWGNGLEIQGETSVQVADIKTLAKDAPFKSGNFTTKGILTLQNGAFEYQNADIAINGQKLRGKLSGTSSPLNVSINFRSDAFDWASVVKEPSVPQTKIFNIQGDVTGKDDGIATQNMIIDIDDMTITGDAEYNGDSGRPLITADLAVNDFRVDKFMSQQVSSPSNASLESTLQSLDLPVDMDITLNLENGLYKNYAVQGLDTSFALRGNSLKVERLNIENFAGAGIFAQGSVQNINTLEGVDLNASLSSDDFQKTISALGLDASNLPDTIKKGTFSVQAKGNQSSLNMTASLKAGGGEMSLEGVLSDVLKGTPTINNMALQLRHKNLNEAIAIIAPNIGSYSNLNKPLDFYTKLSQTGNVYNLSDIKADLGGIDAAGQASIDLSAAKPVVSANLKLGDLVVQGGSSASAGDSAWSRQALSSEWLNALNFDVNIAAKSLDYQGWKFSAPVFDASLQGGTLTLRELKGGLYDGQAFLNGDLKPFNADGGYTINGAAKLRAVSLEPLVRSFTGNRILKGSGLIDIDTDISMAGISASALISSMKGQGVTTGTDIVLDGFNIVRFARALSSEAKPGDALLGLYKTTIKQGQTRFDEMDGQFDIREGIINITALNMDGPEAFLSTKGQVNLPEFYMDTVHEITLKNEDVPPFEIKISGPLGNPTQTLGQGILNDYISRKINRKLEDVIQDKLGGSLDEKLGLPGRNKSSNTEPTTPSTTPEQEQNVSPEQQTQPEKIEPEDALKGLLKGLLQ